MGPDASKAAACATVNHHQNTPQNQTKTQRHTRHENCLTLLSEALKEEVITLPRQRPDCIWQRHTTHENCLTLLSEALKEEVITLPRQRPDCIWKFTISVTSLARSPWNDGVGGYIYIYTYLSKEV